MVSKELSGREIQDMIGEDGMVICYPQLYDYDSIEELFHNGELNKIVILYLQEPELGHWVVLTRYKNVLSFFDSYGIMPDNELNWNSKTKNESLDQAEGNYLTKLMHDYHGTVEYNEKRFQEHSRNINTCGRYCVLRALSYRMPLKKFQEILDSIRKAGVNLDDAIVFMTDSLLKNNVTE